MAVVSCGKLNVPGCFFLTLAEADDPFEQWKSLQEKALGLVRAVDLAAAAHHPPRASLQAMLTEN